MRCSHEMTPIQMYTIIYYTKNRNNQILLSSLQSLIHKYRAEMSQNVHNYSYFVVTLYGIKVYVCRDFGSFHARLVTGHRGRSQSIIK